MLLTGGRNVTKVAYQTWPSDNRSLERHFTGIPFNGPGLSDHAYTG